MSSFVCDDEYDVCDHCRLELPVVDFFERHQYTQHHEDHDYYCVSCERHWHDDAGYINDTVMCPDCGLMTKAFRTENSPLWVDGVTTTCKWCVRKRDAFDLELRESAAQFCKAERMLNRARSRSTYYGVPFSLSVELLRKIMVKICPVLRIRLNYGNSIISDNSPSLDRFCPKQGYVEGNVRVISNLANRIKTNATTEQVEAVAKWMRAVEEAQASQSKYQEPTEGQQ